MRVIAIANQKGGCGKTTTAVNLSVAFAKKGFRVLAMDLDPQGHTTLGLGCNPDAISISIYDVLTHHNIAIADVVTETYVPDVTLAPSNILLSGAELELGSVLGREFIMSEKLRAVNGDFDMCIIDCPPSLGMLTLNSLVASNDVIVPVQVQYYAMEGLKQLMDTVNIIQERYYPCDLKISGLLLTFVEKRVTLSREIQRQMRDFFGDLVFKTVIHRNTRLAEAPSAGESVITFDKRSRGAIEYMQLADEVIYGKTQSRTTQERFINL